jgi:hypothetical protein
MIAFHGTSRAYSQKIFGPPPKVDITQGGGELGMGFYVGEHIALAVSFANKRHPQDAVVLKFDIDDSIFGRLKILVINKRENVIQKWKTIIFRNQRKQYLFHADVICAPYATIDSSRQHKFETIKAQDMLNNNSTITII